MTTFIVTNTDDSGAGSLRDAVLAANATAGADTIVFSSNFDGGAEDLIRLTSGHIEFTEDLTIIGGPAGVTISGDANGDDVVGPGAITDVAASLEGHRLDDNSRIFFLDNYYDPVEAALTLDGLTLTGGRGTGDHKAGGAVHGNEVVLIDAAVAGNYSPSGGGGVWADGVALIHSKVSGNISAGNYGNGGGVWGDSVTLSYSTVTGNSTKGERGRGGGIFGYSLKISNSTVSDNHTEGNRAVGGGISIYGYGYAVLTNSTVSHNSTAGDDANGGGIYGFARSMYWKAARSVAISRRAAARLAVVLAQTAIVNQL